MALLRALVRASEKAACIAQLCRQEDALFQLLVEEKRGADKNKRFVQDFKTLADVLIQEVIKHDVGAEVLPGTPAWPCHKGEGGWGARTRGQQGTAWSLGCPESPPVLSPQGSRLSRSLALPPVPGTAGTYLRGGVQQV